MSEDCKNPKAQAVLTEYPDQELDWRFKNLEEVVSLGCRLTVELSEDRKRIIWRRKRDGSVYANESISILFS